MTLYTRTATDALRPSLAEFLLQTLETMSMHCSTKEFRACCRPTKTGAGLSDARIAAAASHCTGVFLVCAWCLELSRTLECARHRHALRIRVSAPQARAQCLLACLASSCSAISATAVQPSSAAHCGIGRRETRVQARTLRTPVHTACSIVVIGLTALPPPDSSAAAPRAPKKQKLRGRSETS